MGVGDGVDVVDVVDVADVVEVGKNEVAYFRRRRGDQENACCLLAWCFARVLGRALLWMAVA